EIITGKEVVATGMMEEIKRAGLAMDYARNGKIVALVSSGDAGIYGMAGLVWELMRERGWQAGTELDLEIVPGVSALNASASLLGAPLSQDFAAISLSDLLIPWETIEKRLKASARADMVIVLYNPKSQQRIRQIEKAQQLLLTRRSPRTPVGIVTNAYRKGQRVIITDLAHLLEQDIDMLTTIIIGNSQTFVYIDKIVTPRGYRVGNLLKTEGAVANKTAA
ncbi:MAG: precorrin-3B C(17)-methyltransferase, partial [Dehalococcoidia bacterium]|nr:precorrin-3B C(17)-methyltransferase [Dehalococcoidia bacterium]